MTNQKINPADNNTITIAPQTAPTDANHPDHRGFVSERGRTGHRDLVSHENIVVLQNPTANEFEAASLLRIFQTGPTLQTEVVDLTEEVNEVEVEDEKETVKTETSTATLKTEGYSTVIETHSATENDITISNSRTVQQMSPPNSIISNDGRPAPSNDIVFGNAAANTDRLYHNTTFVFLDSSDRVVRGPRAFKYCDSVEKLFGHMETAELIDIRNKADILSVSVRGSSRRPKRVMRNDEADFDELLQYIAQDEGKDIEEQGVIKTRTVEVVVPRK